jgi:flagellar basal body-associated protein FliL
LYVTFQIPHLLVGAEKEKKPAATERAAQAEVAEAEAKKDTEQGKMPARSFFSQPEFLLNTQNTGPAYTRVRLQLTYSRDRIYFTVPKHGRRDAPSSAAAGACGS